MAVQRSTPELADRLATYVEELREFFVSCGMHYGSADDIAPLIARLDDGSSFREDLTSVVRAIILREGGVVPRTHLLEIVAVAIGGTDFDQAGLTIQQPIRQLLVFLNGVAGKPWNEPPGEARLKPERVPGVTHEIPPAASREESPVESQMLPPATSHGEFPIESYGAMLAARHKVVPITCRREIPLESRESAPATSYEEMPIASGAPIAVPFTWSEGAFSRLTHVEHEADGSLGPIPAPIPGPNPGPVPSPIPSPVPPLPLPPAASTPTPAAEVQSRPATTPRLPSTIDPEPPSTPLFAAIHFPMVSIPKSFLSKLSLPKMRIPKFSIPKVSVPKIPMPRFSFTKFSMPRFSAHRKMAIPKFSIPTMFIAVFVGACVSLFAAVRLLVARPHSQSTAQIISRPAATTATTPATTTAATPVDTAADAPAPTPRPTAVRPSKPSPYGSPRYDNYIAPPFSRAIQPTPGESNLSQPNPAASSPAASSPGSQPSAPAADHAADLSDSSTVPPPPRRRYPSVSSGVMTGNLVSAPSPGYPLLAKITHTQGQVVLQAVVAKDGTVAEAHVLRGHHLLRGAAVDAVRRWRYRPYLVDGRPVEVSTTITLNFPSRH